MEQQTHRYDDIIDLPHHVSARHPQMPLTDRAAQFSPFAALTGHEDAIQETARLTRERMELDEDMLRHLDEQLHWLQSTPEAEMTVSITYFVPDDKKSGGAYVTTTGRIARIDTDRRMVCMADRTQIPMDEIVEIDGGSSAIFPDEFGNTFLPYE